MSRFNNPAKALPANTLTGSLPDPGPYPRVASESVSSAAQQSSTGTLADSSSMLATIGFFLYCTYLLSGYANDWAMRLLGDKAYLSTVAVVLLPVVWLLSGQPFRGLQTRIGWWWVAFLVWMVLSTPFSIWRGGSVVVLFNYVPKSYLCFFYTCAFVTTIRRCRYLMYVNIAAAVILLITCVTFGASGAGPDEFRYRIPESLFFSNANYLALALLSGITAFQFLFFEHGIGRQLLGAAGIILSSLYALRTASRGCLLAALAMLALTLITSRSKLKVVIAAVVIGALALVSVPSGTLHRLSLLAVDPGADANQSNSDLSSMDSSMQRRELFKKSLYYTVTNPLFGVGLDQFPVAVNGDAEKEGRHVAWLGTHNTYTQVSSEAGIPALIFYCAVIALCFRTNYRLYKRTRDEAMHRDIAGLSFCLLAATVVYAVTTFFFHILYTSTLPMLAGFTAALHLASGPVLESGTGRQRG